ILFAVDHAARATTKAKQTVRSTPSPLSLTPAEKDLPDGCEGAFSPYAEPAKSRIIGRCVSSIFPQAEMPSYLPEQRWKLSGQRRSSDVGAHQVWGGAPCLLGAGSSLFGGVTGSVKLERAVAAIVLMPAGCAAGQTAPLPRPRPSSEAASEPREAPARTAIAC